MSQICPRRHDHARPTKTSYFGWVLIFAGHGWWLVTGLMSPITWACPIICQSWVAPDHWPPPSCCIVKNVFKSYNELKNIYIPRLFLETCSIGSVQKHTVQLLEQIVCGIRSYLVSLSLSCVSSWTPTKHHICPRPFNYFLTNKMETFLTKSADFIMILWFPQQFISEKGGFIPKTIFITYSYLVSTVWKKI